MTSLVSQFTQYNELYPVVKFKIQRTPIKVSKKYGDTNMVLSFKKYLWEIPKKKKEMKKETHKRI